MTDLPLPVIDEENRAYWEGLRRHELLLQRCRSCQAWQTPVSLRCTFCLADDLEWRPASGRGHLYSYVIYHQAYDPAFRERLPYNAAIVELEEGPRLVANVVGCPDEALRIGMPLEAVFEDVTPEVTLAKFRPAARP